MPDQRTTTDSPKDHKPKTDLQRYSKWQVLAVWVGSMVLCVVGGAILVWFCRRLEPPKDTEIGIPVFMGYVSLIAIGAQVIVSRMQWKAMQDGMKLTRELVELTERPSLGIQGIDKIIYEPFNKISVHAELKNSGKSPARNVYTLSYLRVYEATTLADCGLECPIPDPLPLTGIRSPSVLPVNASRTLTPEIDHMPDIAECIRFGKGELVLFLWVYVTYESFGGTEYFLKYYVRFEDGGFSECPEHNDAS